MSKSPQNNPRTKSRSADSPGSPDDFALETPWESASNVLRTALDALASLRLTVALLAMAIFIVLAGTLGQVHREIWDVIHDYFRMSFSGDSAILASFSLFGKDWIIPSPMTWIDLSIFFPPSFWEGNEPPDLSKWSSPARIITSLVMGVGWAALIWLIPMRDKKFQLGLFAALGLTFSLLSIKMNGFWFPKGWTIGLVMAANLLSAHLIRFKIQAKGARLWAGVGVIALGILTTYGVIKSGSNKEGVLEENRFLGGLALDWDTIWILFEFTLAVVLVLGIWGYISLWRRTLRNPDLTASERSATVIMRRIAGFCNLALAGLLTYLIVGGTETQLNNEGMRILWQLLKATAAGLILLAGAAMVFRKRAGVVVLHSGVALIMLSELLVGVSAVETQMQIVEGESANYVQDIREVEIVVVDPSDPEKDHVVAIPTRLIKDDNLIQDDRLPVNIHVDEFYKHSVPEEVKNPKENPATEGVGKFRIAKPARGSTGTDNASEVDVASAYVTLYSKTESGENDKNLGTWLISQYFDEQEFEVDGNKYQLDLRFKRYYKPYTITLNDVSRENYVGTNTPRDYRSIIDLKDPTRNENREDVHIWMNNPLRYGGETFYQSGYHELPSGVEVTTLSVVTNKGWMIPYVACMIVAVGMLAHFLITLTRFLNRDARTAPTQNPLVNDEAKNRRGMTPASGPASSGELDPLHEPPANRWLTPVLSIGLVLVFGGYLAKKAVPPEPSEEGFDFYKAGQIPVVAEGRVKPLDSLARNTLTKLSNRQTYVDSEGNKQPAIRWFLDLVARNEASGKNPVFRIDYQPLLDMLKLPKRKGHLYSFDEILKEGSAFQKQVELASSAEAEERNIYQEKVLELAKSVQMRSHLADTFMNLNVDGDDAYMELLEAYRGHKQILESHNKAKKGQGGTGRPMLDSRATNDWELPISIILRHELATLAAEHNAETTSELAEHMVEDFARTLVSFRIEQERFRIKRNASKNQQTFNKAAEAARDNATNETLKAVYEVLANSRPRDEAVDLVARLPETVRERLYPMEALTFVTEIIKRLPGIDLSQIRELVQQRTGETANPDETTVATVLLETLAEQLMTDILDNKSLSTFADEAPYGEIFAAYERGDAEAFNQAVAEYHETYADNPPEHYKKPVSQDKLAFEAFFNQAAPFWYLAVIYLIAGLLAAVSWLACFQPLNRATFWLLVFALIVHTAALVGRIYISGRPPVTNLYSSAVFIGWGCVLMGLMFEWFYDIGIGNVVASAAGFLTLGIAHLLMTVVSSSQGDTFTVMQAVLDTQFWLATHVVCISMGYAATYVAGFLGLAYIIGGAFTPLLTAKRRKDLLRMIYGTLCFAIFFSFVGTVLGGLWADDSWGRFWGWDTKENGALIIVLWNAMVLHARWGGIVKERGLAALVVAGNITVSWSWFGVNELGIGLHSYGKTDGVIFALSIFCVSQLLMVAVGCLPKQYWWSHIAEGNEAKA